MGKVAFERAAVALGMLVVFLKVERPAPIEAEDSVLLAEDDLDDRLFLPTFLVGAI